MDNAEAIRRIKDHIKVHHIGEYPHIKIAEAMNLAISALANDNNVGRKLKVVRCTDCKHNEDCIRRIQFWGRDSVLELNTTEYHPIEFCSYGERRTDG